MSAATDDVFLAAIDVYANAVAAAAQRLVEGCIEAGAVLWPEDQQELTGVEAQINHRLHYLISATTVAAGALTALDPRATR